MGGLYDAATLHALWIQFEELMCAVSKMLSKDFELNIYDIIRKNN